MKISYNWLKWYIPEIPEVDKLSDIFTFHLCEVESVEKLSDGDTIFDINILPNRAHDLLSHAGVAYELSALCDIPYNDPTLKYKIPKSEPTNLKVSIDPTTSANGVARCRRYSARIIRNIKVGPSPDWVVKYLESIGQRSINNIVDATNLTLFDCGQPTHAFDLDKLKVESDKSKVEILVKNAKEGEEIELLGSDKIIAKLKDTDLVITNKEGKAIAIAGVKGSTNSGVTDETKDIIIEIANFDPVAVRKTGRRLGLLSDAQKRFENDLSPERATYGMRELSALIVEMFPEAVFEEIVDIYPSPQIENKITISRNDINSKLGSKFSIVEIESVWQRMKFQYEKNDDEFTITVPVLRIDLTGKHDLIEEVGRVTGYDKIMEVLPAIDFKPQINEVFYKTLCSRKKLMEDGFREVATYSLTKKGVVELARATKGKEKLRTNLLDGLRDSYELNKLNAPLLQINENNPVRDREGSKRLPVSNGMKIFEIGNVFPEKGVEETHVAYMDNSGAKEMTLEEFTKEIKIGDSYDELLSTLNPQPSTSVFKIWSQYPFIVRDIAVWVPDGTDSSILTEVYTEQGGELLACPPVSFDTFSKDGRTSLGFRLVFQAQDRTLTDAEINDIMSKIEIEISKNKEFNIR